MRRLDKGAPIRDAIRAAGLDIPRLAAKTQQIDPGGDGLSKAYIGFIVGRGKTARDECSDRAAELIAKALDVPLSLLFEAGPSMPTESTSTPRSQTRGSRKSLPVQLMNQRELADFLRKSMSWIDQQIKDHDDWPVHYAGRSRRFDPYEVLAYLGERRKAAQPV